MDAPNRAFLAMAAAWLGVWVIVSFAACAAAAVVIDTIVGGPPSRSIEAGLLPALALTVVTTAGTVMGWVSLRRQLVATERLARVIRRDRVRLPNGLAAIAETLRLSGRIDLVAADEPFAVTYGFVRPRIAMSTALVDAASSPAELRAVLEHEAYHARNLDPLKLLLARWLEAVFFYLPVLRDLRARYLLTRELAADRRAAERCGVPPLARALLNVGTATQRFGVAAGAALGGTELLPARIAQLESGAEPPGPPLTRSGVTTSGIAIALLIGLVVMLAASMTGAGIFSMPMMRGSLAATVVGMSVCVAWPLWLGWHVSKWLVARPWGAA